MKIGDEIKTYTFSEGEYGERMNYLRLEGYDDENDKKKSFTFGIYHLSGTNNTGFVFEPGGPSSSEGGHDVRIPTGTYNLSFQNPVLKEGFEDRFTVKWPGYPLIYNDNVDEDRGIRIHWSKTTFREWTLGCLIVTTKYDVKNCTYKNIFESSKSAVKSIISYFEENVSFEQYTGKDGYRNSSGSDRYFYPYYPSGGSAKNKALIIKSIFND